MRAPLMIMLTFGLTACAPTVPESGAGVGFQDYNSYVRNRSTVTVDAAPVPSATSNGFSTDAAAAAIDRAAGVAPAAQTPIAQPPAVQDPIAPLPAGNSERPRGNAPAGIQQEAGEVVVVTGGVSDEQDFAAVTQRETIESDKARIERNRATYTVDQPSALPQRNGSDGDGATIVAFALATTHAPGTQIYDRSSIRLSSSQAACGRFASPDLAQEAFLAAGGPDRDRKGLDPDGDGFACSWDPRPFRTALQ